jgi:hypothetical protein
MTFNGICGITKEKFEEIILKKVDRDIPKFEKKLFDELKKLIRQGQLKQFEKDEEYKPSRDVKEIILKASEESEEESRGAGGYAKISQLGDWYVGVKPDGTIGTNIVELDNNKWINLAAVWVGLNSVVGMKKDGALIQAGSDPTLCDHVNIKNAATRTYLGKKEWAVQLQDESWEYFDGTKKSKVKSASLDELGNISVV